MTSSPPPEARRHPVEPGRFKLVCPHCKKRHFLGDVVEVPAVQGRTGYVAVSLKPGFFPDTKRPNYWRYNYKERYKGLERGRAFKGPVLRMLREKDPNFETSNSLRAALRSYTTDRHPRSEELEQGVHVVQCDGCDLDVTVTVAP